MEIAVKNEKILDSPSPTDGLGAGGASSDTGSGAELQKQQSLEKSTNSHHHDSEYDTASDLEDYSEDGESGGADNKENGSSTGSDFEDDGEAEEEDEENDDDENKKKVDYTKKVDEDRSNPQYIPKKGTFYEHDDRTADDPSSVLQISDKATEGESNTKTTSNASVSTNSASKTMKQWQPASARDRWSHDRYDENEQAPKSRSELVSAYGYDIRSEDGPPHARRKRHYGRGPSKYNRKWEDESAYIKSNNSQRKPPRPEDFPSLADKRSQRRDQRLSRSKEEKENHFENREPRNEHSDHGDRGDRKRDNYRRNDRDRRSNKNYNNHKTVEFINRNRSNNNNFDNQRKSQNSNDGHEKSQLESLSFTNTKVSNNPISSSSANIKQTTQHQSNERYNGHIKEQINDSKQSNNTNYKLPQLQQSQQPKLQNSLQATASQLSVRLQQVASNAPSHVGSVQMHSLATQQSTQPQSLSPSVDIHQQQHQEPGRPKRYSSLRSRQNDQALPQQGSGNLDQHATLQQLQQLRDASSQQRQQVLLQANLMQLYQENIQAAAAHQMQGVVPIQSLQQPQNQQKPPSQYQNPPPSYQNAAGAGYYTQPPPPTASADYSYLPQQQPSAVTAGTTQIPYHASAAPNPTPYVQAQATPNPVPAGTTSTAAPYPNYPQTTAQPQPYQPYNTVGGTTYFVGHTQPAPRTTTTLPQRRPTNAIPILAPPSDKNKSNNNQLEKDGINNTNSDVESIDHILDNMFVQRQYQPQQMQPAAVSAVSTIPGVNSNISTNSDNSVATNLGEANKIEDAMKNISINDAPVSATESIIEKAENSPPPS